MNHAESEESKELLELLKGIGTLPSLPPYARDWVHSCQVLESISGYTTSESRHEQFPFPSWDLTSCCFQPEP